MKTTTQKTITFYAQKVRKYPKKLAGILFAIPFTVLVANILPPLILSKVLNKLSKHDYQPHAVWASFGPELVAYSILVLLGGLVTWRIVDYFGWTLESKVQTDIAQQIYKHLLSQSADFHANNFGGSLVSQSSKSLGAYVRIADTTIFQTLPLFFSLIFVVIILLGRAPLYAISLFLFAIFYIICAFIVTRKVRQLGSEYAKFESTQTGHLADAITNVMTIKSFARHKYEQTRFAKATTNTERAHNRLMHANRRQQTIFTAITGTMSSFALLMAVISVVVFGADLATVFLILSYTTTIVSQLYQFSNNGLRTYNRALGDAAEMVEILDTPPGIVDPEKPEKLSIVKGSIAFEDVEFTHDNSSDALFERLNLTIRHGEKVGLVGHSGSGKTTFTRLLLRFSDVDAGRITIDGQDIAKISQDDLHSKLAYVPQEPLLFHRSIRENIAYGKEGATDKEVLTAATRANAHEFVKGLPDGYDTLVGERGVKLSGGQRQRIAIARAMLKDAPILLLDEATSALDSESEVLIQDALWKLMEGRTAIVIAHRLSTIQKMDRIVVLHEGEITEEGSHQELLAQRGGTYAKLWAHQSGGFIED
ncbi:MAG: MdlB, multidrug/protein/lipid transporter ATPase, ATP-binding cassette, subfamily bacterial [Candidatus Saccharibacteria bacterium]|nr:MdlB, multidrug/protein/lipid transporter ATPase, ATP-binding cassette, subfamily bacterial [Candidatus Saccharibacteria bacterium]